MKKRIITFFMMTIILLGWCGVTQAASTSMSATNTSPTVDANITITVKFSQPLATADFSLTYDSSKLQYVSNTIGGTNTGSSVVVGYIDFPALTTKSSASFTFKAKAAGTANCSVVWASASDAKGNEFVPTGSSISINVKNKPTPKPDPKPDEKPDQKPNDNTNNNTNTDKKPTFTNVNQKVYAKETVSIRDTWSTSGKLLGTLQKGSSITRRGIGSNGWDKVTYNGRTAYISHTYLTTTKPKDDKDDDKDKDKDKNNTTNEVSNNTTNNEIANNTSNNEVNNQTNDVTNSETNEATNTQTQGNTQKGDKKGFSVNTIEIIIISVIVLAIIVIIINEILAKKREEKRRAAKKRDEKRVKGSRR